MSTRSRYSRGFSTRWGQQTRFPKIPRSAPLNPTRTFYFHFRNPRIWTSFSLSCQTLLSLLSKASNTLKASHSSVILQRNNTLLNCFLTKLLSSPAVARSCFPGSPEFSHLPALLLGASASLKVIILQFEELLVPPITTPLFAFIPPTAGSWVFGFDQSNAAMFLCS